MKHILSFFLTAALFITLSACGQAPVEESADKSGPTWQEQYDLGVRYLSEGNYQEAIIAFTVAIEIDPKQAPAYMGRGDAYIRSGETEENLLAAQTDYEMAIELDRTSVDAYLGLADVYIRLGDYDKALELLRQGLEKTGGNQEIFEKTEEINTGTISDSSGKIRRMTCCDGGGAVLFWHDYTYNAQGQQDSVTSFNATGVQTAQVGLTYDENGNELISYWYDAETGEVGRFENTYDSAGNVVSAILYNPDGSLMSAETYTYNSAGQLTRMDSKYDNHSHYDLYEYDSQGNQTKRSMYADDGILSAYQLFTYNENGQELGSQWYSGDGELERSEIHHYDEQGELIASDEYDATGNLINSWAYN